MGRNIPLTFISLGVIAVFVAYLASQTLPPGSQFARVFQVTATSAVLCHVLGGIPNGIWFGKRLRFFITDAIDGLAYSLATGAIFAALWPAA
jgi:cytochrome c biogenesis protein CcdA